MFSDDSKIKQAKVLLPSDRNVVIHKDKSYCRQREKRKTERVVLHDYSPHPKQLNERVYEAVTMVDKL